MKKLKLSKKKKELKAKLKTIQEEHKQRYELLRQERKERRDKLLKAFGYKIFHNKKYLLSLIITVVFISKFIYNELSVEVNKIRIANDIQENVVEPTIKVEKLEDEVDVTNYIGIYSRTINLNQEIKLNTCSMNSYKLVYKIESNKKISKYLVSDCTGTKLIYENTLNYYNNGGARYIGSEQTNYIFGTNSMKEVDGETYKIDEDISKISERLIDKAIDIYFVDNNIIISTNDNLYLFKESVVAFQIPSTYENNGGNLTKRVYKNEGYSFKFIVFSNGENKTCYEAIEEEQKEELLYTIYQVTYNKENNEFETIKQILSRNKGEGCNSYKEDLENLKG